MTAPGAAGNCPRLDDSSGHGTSGPGTSPASNGTDAAGDAPAPPSLGEAAATCALPEDPVIGRNPDPEGVTGMATYLWAQPQPARSSTAAIRGYAVTCTITPMRWTWHTGDGGTYTRDRPGGAHPDHAAEHVYETKGDYDMRLAVLWRASTNYGSAALTRTTTQSYHVFEIRSVLTG